MKNKGMVTIGAALVVVLAMFAGCGGRTGEREYGKALKAWEKGNLVQARSLFEKATGRLSGNERKSEAFNNLGLVLWQLDEPAAAAEAFNNACTLSESITDARLNLGVAQFYADDLDGAKVSLNMYLGQHPGNTTALAVQSMIAARRRDWAQSSRIMTDAAKTAPSDPALQNALALAELNHQQNSAQAVSRLKRVAATHPDYTPALFNLGVIHDQWLRDKATAIGYYQQYLAKAGPDASHAETARNAITRLSGTATTNASADPDAALRFMKEGTRLHGEKKYTEAVAQFEMAVEADPGDARAYYNLGLSSFQMADYTGAQQAFSHALTLDPAYADARYMLSYCYYQQKNWDAAEREAKILSRTDAKRGGDMLRYIENARK